MSKRILIADIRDDEEDEDLRNLLEKYIRRSEDLEKRESKVMKQIELMQSAVHSLQTWNQSRKASAASSMSVHLDPDAIEEETKLIREETARIQEEVRQKEEENRILMEVVNKRRGLRSGTDVAPRESPGPADNQNRKKRERQVSPRPGVEFFDEKLRKLKETERKLKKESEAQSEESKKRNRNMEQKLEVLEWESQIDKQILGVLKKKPARK